MYIKRWLFLGLLLVFTLSFGAEMRYWHDRSGTVYVGEFSREFLGKVYLRGTDGRLINVVTTNLVDSDVAYIRALILPAVQIKFRVKERENTDYPSEYDPGRWDDHEIEVMGQVIIKKKSAPPYSGTLHGEVYLIAKEVATDDYRLFAKKRFDITFPAEKSSEFEYNLTQTLRHFVMRGEMARGAHYKGYVVIVEDPDGGLMAFDSNLSWMNEEKIDALRKIPCPGFMNDYCKKRSVPRPSDFRSAGGTSY